MTNTERWIKQDPKRLEAFHTFIRRRFLFPGYEPDAPLPCIGVENYRKAVDDFAENRKP